MPHMPASPIVFIVLISSLLAFLPAASAETQTSTENSTAQKGTTQTIPDNIWLQATRQLRQQLATSDDPKDWAQAVLLPNIFHDAPSEEVLSQKLEAASIIIPGETVDPNNAAYWINELWPYGWTSKEEKITEILEKTAQARFFDSHMGETFKARLDLYDRLRPLIASSALSKQDFILFKHVATFNSNHAIFTNLVSRLLVDMCSPSDPTLAKIRKPYCTAIGQKMINAPADLTARATGYRLLEATGTIPQSASLSYQNVLWLQQQGTELQAKAIGSPEKIALVDADWQNYADEITVTQRLLSREGVSLEPPKGASFDSKKDGIINPSGISPSAMQTLNKALSQLLAELQKSTEPGDWLLAISLGACNNNEFGEACLAKETQQQLLDRALATIPENTTALKIALVFYANKGTSESSREKLNTLVQIEPDNLFGWLYAISSAYRKKDFLEATLLLKQAAQAKHYQTPNRQLLPDILKVLGKLPSLLLKGDQSVSTDELARYQLYKLFSVLISSGIPPYTGFMQYCSPIASDGLFQIDNFDICVKIAARLATSSETWIDLSIAFNALDYLGTLSPKSIGDYRQLRWQLDRGSALLQENIIFPGSAQKTFADWQANGTEISVTQRVMQRAGVSLTPPDDWEDDTVRRHQQNVEKAKLRLNELREAKRLGKEPSQLTPTGACKVEDAPGEKK